MTNVWRNERLTRQANSRNQQHARQASHTTVVPRREHRPGERRTQGASETECGRFTGMFASQNQTGVNPDLRNPGLRNPGLRNPGLRNPGLRNPVLRNPGPGPNPQAGAQSRPVPAINNQLRRALPAGADRRRLFAAGPAGRDGEAQHFERLALCGGDCDNIQGSTMADWTLTATRAVPTKTGDRRERAHGSQDGVGAVGKRTARPARGRWRRVGAGVVACSALAVAAALVSIGLATAWPTPTLAQKSKAGANAGRPKPTRFKVPRAEALILLARTSLVTLGNAVATGNFTVLRDVAAPSFQRTNSAATLARIFANPLRHGGDFRTVAVLSPKLTKAPYVDVNNRLHLEGYFRSGGLQYNFRLIFEVWAGHWRLFGISANSSPAAKGGKKNDPMRFNFSDRKQQRSSKHKNKGQR